MHKQNETAQKIAARAFAQWYLADLLPSVFGSLRDGGYFFDPVERVKLSDPGAVLGLEDKTGDLGPAFTEPIPVSCLSASPQSHLSTASLAKRRTSKVTIVIFSNEPGSIEIQRHQQSKRRALARRRTQEQLRAQTPEPVEGRKHVDVQTELYLEEIADRIIEVDMECQTDAFLDRPPTPLFIPAKTGKDVATQILEGESIFTYIEIGFLPWLMDEVDKTMEYSMVGRTVLDTLIREVIERRLTMYEHVEKHQPLKPEDGLGGAGAMRGPLVGYDFREQSASQSQRSLADR
ncbi:PREDICTED: radial spoke head protein 3 homolog, partial [Hipposideros armiger]|uniref:Radial spoke head protein 3 homolog n=1 Tax=Hipposideros armiger TaxID=186990 RepID=A0A8B7T5C9_HIPAR